MDRPAHVAHRVQAEARPLQCPARLQLACPGIGPRVEAPSTEGWTGPQNLGGTVPWSGGYGEDLRLRCPSHRLEKLPHHCFTSQ